MSTFKLNEFSFTDAELHTLREDLDAQKKRLERITPIQSIWIDMAHAAAIKTMCRMITIGAEENGWRVFWEPHNEKIFATIRAMIITVTAMYTAISFEWPKPVNNNGEPIARKILDMMPQAPDKYIKMFMSYCGEIEHGNFVNAAVAKARQLAEDIVNCNITGLLKPGAPRKEETPEQTLKRLDSQVFRNAEKFAHGTYKACTGAEAVVHNLDYILDDAADDNNPDNDPATVDWLDQTIKFRDEGTKQSDEDVDENVEELDKLVSDRK